jgi:PIN domain nuclease of toxin-antitoxin system
LKLLLDTHIALWAAYAPTRLPVRARQLLEDEHNELVFSAASIWETTIKSGRDRSPFGVAPSVFRRGLIESGYVELDITSAHAVAVGDLPPVHRDPFDRMLIAQARVEGLTLLTADEQMDQYGPPVLLV